MEKMNINSLEKELNSNLFAEMETLKAEEISGGALNPWDMISILGGNKGKYCTLTIECMPSCN